MPRVRHPKYSSGPEKSIYYGSCETFPNEESSTERIAAFRVFLERFVLRNGIKDCAFGEDVFNTGGHSDIDYYALIASDKSGGCECVFYTINWGGSYEAMTPFVTLYGSWVKWEEMLSAILEERYGGGSQPKGIQ